MVSSPDSEERSDKMKSIPSLVRHHSYNPFEHRRIAKPSSDVRSFLNLLKASLGSGILAMPLAFANSGWLVGLIGTLIIAFLCGHCVQIFVETSRACCKKDKVPVLGYAATCRSTFDNGPARFKKLASAAYVVSEVSLICTYLGVCCIFTVLIGDSIKQPFDEYIFNENIRIEYYCAVIILPLCLMVQVRHLTWLAPFSLIANVMLVGTFAICLYYVFGDTINFTDKKTAGDIARFPAYLSTVIFAMEGIGVVMPVENSMKTPEHFLGCPGVLAVVMTFIAILYTILGMFGYFRYGDALRGSITLNLPIDEWPAICAKCFIAISIFFTYPLHFYVVIDTLVRFLDPYIKDKYHTVSQVLLRIGCVCLCGALGIILPMLEQIINIVGAVFYSLLGLIIPAIIQTVFRWENLGKWKWILWKNLILALFGFGCMVSGLIVAIMDILQNYNKRDK